MKKLFATALMLLPAAAMAHVGEHSLLNWKIGFLHPLSGLDHLLGVVAAGIWFAQGESRNNVAFLAGFAAILALAIVAGTQFTHVGLESGIVGALIVLGALMACAFRGPLILRILVIGAVAAIHGFVHGTELPSGTGALPFAMALILSSLLLVMVAIIIGKRSETFTKGKAARIAGVLLMAFGFGIAV